MPKIELDDEDGIIEVNIKSGTDKSAVKLDMWKACNSYAAICDQHADAVERGNAWVEWLTGAGVPPLTHGQAFRLADAIVKEVETFKKKSGILLGMPDSVASTASTAPG